MAYIKKESGNLIPPGYNQYFLHKLSVKVQRPEILKYKETGSIFYKDLKIVEFLYDVKFATREQIIKYCDSMKEEFKDVDINETINRLVNRWILNKFILSDLEEAETKKELGNKANFPSDALVVYCLCEGGGYYLAANSEKNTTDFTVADTRVASGVVGKQLLATEMYIKILHTCKSKSEYFVNSPVYNCGKVIITSNFEFCLRINEERKYFIGVIFRQNDDIKYIRDVVLSLESLLKTKSWKKYFPDSNTEPVLFIFADTEDKCLEVSKELEVTGIERYRLSTDSRISNIALDEKGAFMKYEEETLKDVKSAFFKTE